MSYSPLKILHGKLGLSTTINNEIISKPRGPCLPLAWWVGRRSGLVGVCNVKFGNSLASGGQSSPKLTPTLSASSHVPEEGILTGTYFVRDQVPDCPDFTRAKNKLPSWDKYFRHRHNWLTGLKYLLLVFYYIVSLFYQERNILLKHKL